MLVDVQRFRRRLLKINKAKTAAGQANEQAMEQAREQLAVEMEQSIAIARSRKQNLPVISYPENLPISQKSELIKKTISENHSVFLNIAICFILLLYDQVHHKLSYLISLQHNLIPF